MREAVRSCWRHASPLCVRVAVVAASAASLTTGCMPHIMHGPRVDDDGVSGSLSLTLGHNREVGEMDTRIVPSLYGGLRRSWVSADGRGPAASVGVQVPVLLAPLFAGNEDGFKAVMLTSYADVYVQPSRRAAAGWEWGVGGLASTGMAGPYVQVGRIGQNGNGWYTTQLIAFGSDDFATGTFYMPTVAWRYRDQDATTAANLSVGMGFGFDEGNDHMDALFIIGVTLELGLRGN